MKLVSIISGIVLGRMYICMYVHAEEDVLEKRHVICI